MLYYYDNEFDSILYFYLDRIYRIFRISVYFHHFPDENDEIEPRKAGKKYRVMSSTT